MSVFRYGLDGPAIESWCEARSSAPVPTGPGGHLVYYTMGTWCLFPDKAVGAWRWTPTPSNAEVKEEVELYISSPSGPSWPVLWWTLFTVCLFLKLLFNAVDYIPTGMKEIAGTEERVCNVYLINRRGQSRENKSCPPPRYRMVVHRVYTERKCARFTTQLNSEDISLYQDVRTQKIVTAVVYCNNFNVI